MSKLADLNTNAEQFSHKESSVDLAELKSPTTDVDEQLTSTITSSFLEEINTESSVSTQTPLETAVAELDAALEQGLISANLRKAVLIKMGVDSEKPDAVGVMRSVSPGEVSAMLEKLQNLSDQGMSDAELQKAATLGFARGGVKGINNMVEGKTPSQLNGIASSLNDSDRSKLLALYTEFDVLDEDVKKHFDLEAMQNAQRMAATKYTKTSNMPFDPDLIGHVERLSQQDSRWGKQSYGNSSIGYSGCGPTSVAMVARYYGIDVLPKDIADFSANNGHYAAGQGTFFSLYPAAAKHLGLSTTTTGTDLSSIKAHLEKGHPLVLSIKTGALGYAGHLMVIDGYDPQTGQFSIKDPGHNNVQSLTDAKLREIIKGSWAFHK